MTKTHFLQGILAFCILLGHEAEALPRNTISMGTQLSQIDDYPTWLIELRNFETGSLVPWQYNFQKYANNQWIVIPEGAEYQITASEIHFLNGAVFYNVCDLEHRTFLHQSIALDLSGQLTPESATLLCRVRINSNTP